MSLISGTISGIMGANATDKASERAANAQTSSTDAQVALAREQMKQAREDFAPYKAIGDKAAGAYDKMLYGGYDMKESPAAQYQLAQGTKALNRSLASRGLSGSGNAAQRISDLNSSVAASDWNAQYNRLSDALKLGTGASASMGSAANSAANTMANAYGQQASNLGNIYQQQGQNQASLYAGLGGMTSKAVGQGMAAYNAYNAYQAASAAPAAAEAAMYVV